MNTSGNFIINLLRHAGLLSATNISNEIPLGLRTTQRALQVLLDANLIYTKGKGKNTVYGLTSLGFLTYQPDLKIDLSQDRLEKDTILFNFEIFKWLAKYDFPKNQDQILQKAATTYRAKIDTISDLLKKREFERLIVEFSWKSSSIEGDTYTLLDTEKLLLQGEINKSKSPAEAQMILNHKSALDFILQNPKYFKILSIKKILELHKLITQKLGVNNDFRKSGVGIIGSLYRPIENPHQIREAFENTIKLVNEIENPLLKAMLISLLIAYIQPFEDGNKRTARILANAILYSFDLPQLSYRTTNIEEYRNAILCFYELNSLHLWQNIFVEQIQFFSQNYF